MPLRITKDNTQPGRVTLMLEGTVVPPWINELHRQCLNCFGSGTIVVLDLRQVDFVDQRGVSALKGLVQSGATLANVPPIIGELLSDSDGP